MSYSQDNMPGWMKGAADFIQRIGFPIFIALAIAAYHAWYVNKIQGQQDGNAEKITNALNKNTDATTALRHFLTHKYDN